ncbi:MAG: hypothetical protein ISS92_06835 [Candidatus Omnitrophica bacterium]|nr:hypothetical protein [Candidatus Omnitrophota bacterium]
MKAIFNFLALTCLAVFALSNACGAEDMTVITDKFYGGIADIIERDMDNPDRCLREVENYYHTNQRTVEKIRNMSEKYMKKAIDMAKKYDSMSEEELKAYERELPQDVLAKPITSEGRERYAKAMQDFAMKHPQYAFRIAAKSVELMPRVDID